MQLFTKIHAVRMGFTTKKTLFFFIFSSIWTVVQYSCDIIYLSRDQSLDGCVRLCEMRQTYHWGVQCFSRLKALLIQILEETEECNQSQCNSPFGVVDCIHFVVQFCTLAALCNHLKNSIPCHQDPKKKLLLKK